VLVRGEDVRVSDVTGEHDVMEGRGRYHNLIN